MIYVRTDDDKSDTRTTFPSEKSCNTPLNFNFNVTKCYASRESYNGTDDRVKKTSHVERSVRSV